MSGFFHGRGAELERLRALSQEPVAVIVGLAGIGKTELAFQAINQLQVAPEWREVLVTRTIVDPAKAASVHAFLLARLTGETSSRPLERLVAVLSRERHIVALDDAHHAPVEIAALVDELGRRACASRLIVTSRVELPVETTPVVVRLGPLADCDARSLALHLAERLGVRIENLEEVVERSAGSPLVLRHVIAGGRVASGIDPVEATLASLDSEALRSLVQLAAVSGCSQSRLAASTLVPDDRVLQALKERCLVDCGPDRVVVHGLIRDLVMPRADSALVAESRRAVAGALWEAFQHHQQPLFAIEAICLTASVGDVEQALARMSAASRTITSAGLDLMVLPIAERLAEAGSLDAALLVARAYLRMTRIDDAARVLERQTAAVDDPRVLALRATIAERVCDLPAASAALEAALARTPGGRYASLLRMRLAVVKALAGEAEAARACMDDVDRELSSPSDVDAARVAWVRAVMHALRQDWPQAEVAVATGRAAAARSGARDLDYLLLLLSLLVASERGDVARSRELLDEVTRALPTRPVRERMTDLYLGIARLTAGKLDEALETLRRAYADLRSGHDTLLSLLAGHYLGRALLIRGDARAAADVLREVVASAVERGLVPLIGVGRAHLARAALSAGNLEEAAQIARELIDHSNPAVAAKAHAVIAYTDAFSGSLGAARRQITRALARIGDSEPALTHLILDEAQLETLGGDPERIRIAAMSILRDERRSARPYARGRALIALAVADLATGDVASALGALADAEAIAAEHGMQQLRDRASFIRYATSLPRGASFEYGAPEHRPGYIGLLRLLGHRSDTIVVTSRTGRVHLDPARLVEVSREHDLLVELTSGTLIGRSGARVEGRGTSSAILVALAESPEPLAPERLYQLVWGGTGYHPLRHRNTLYIALNRTRKLVREVGEEREVIVREGDGWTIAREIDLAIARRDPRAASTTTVRSGALVEKAK